MALRKDELNLNGLFLFQDPDTYCFGMDTVLLAHFARADRETVLDLGTGNGALPVLLSGLYTPKHITGIELQPVLYENACLNMEANGLQDRVTLLQGDYKTPLVAEKAYTLVIANPPYYPVGSGTLGKNEIANRARFELTATIRDVIAVAKRALTADGRLCLVYRTRWETALRQALAAQELHSVRTCYVHPRADKKATLLLLEARLQAGEETVLPPLYVHEKEGYTPQMAAIYQGELI